MKKYHSEHTRELVFNYNSFLQKNIVKKVQTLEKIGFGGNLGVIHDYNFHAAKSSPRKLSAKRKYYHF